MLNKHLLDVECLIIKGVKTHYLNCTQKTYRGLYSQIVTYYTCT
jgi:hypothetical protein